MAQSESATGLTVRHRFSASSCSFLTHAGTGLGGGEQEVDVIMLDHCYSKPWSAHPDASSARPLRMLFMPKYTRPSTLELLQRNIDPPIDVVDALPAPSMPFDINKARNLMTECERHASYARTDSQEDWEDKVSKAGWNIQQTRLFTKVLKILQTDRLARLAMDSIGNEPIARRQVVDKTAKRLRHAFASVGWDMNVVQWLHQLILDSFSVYLLACYLDALQALKAKVPALVDKMVAQSGAPPKHPSLSQESLGLLLKRPWDPVGSALTQQKLKKLPGNPLLLIAPSGPTQSSSSHCGHAKRLKFWQVHLNTLGKTIPTNMSGGSGVSVVLCLEQMIGALRTKVVEQKSHHPGRPIILVGWNVGALVACHVSLVESVNAVVCLGFPFTGIHGPRGDCEDPLLGSQTPTLFVIGQNACDCSIDQLQDLREHMHAETGMLVVGGADEQLRLSHRQKREEGLTQAMADRCIIDEVYQFLGSILSMNAGLPDLPSAEVAQIDPRKKRKRKMSQDLIGLGTVEKRLTATASRESSVGTSPVLVSATGRMPKRGGKAARLMTTACGTSVSAERGRAVPRKRQGRGGMTAGTRKRMSLGLGQLGAHTNRSVGQQSASASGMTTISSAPELSGLLQGICVTRANEGESVLMGGTRSLMSASFPLAKVLSVSKLMEGGSSGSAGSATLLASAVRSGDAADKEKGAQHQQFLVKTGGSAGAPFTIPISMAQRLMASGSSPLVHITGTGSSSPSQIHQLLTSIARSSTSTSSASAPQTALLVNTTAVSSGHQTTFSVQAGSGTKSVAGKTELLLNSAGQKKGERGTGNVVRANDNQKESGPDAAAVGKISSQYHLSALTTQSKPATLLAQTSSTSTSQTNVPDPDTVLTQASLKSQGALATKSTVPTPVNKQISLTKQISGAAAVIAAEQVSLIKQTVSNPGTGMSQSSLIYQQPSLTNQTTINASSTEVAKSTSGESVSVSQPVLLNKTSLVHMAATKSLINAPASTAHPISAKVLAGCDSQAARAGSPIVTSAIIGDRNAVLIPPSVAKSFSSAPTTFLLSKPSPGTGIVTTTSKPSGEILGKVSSVLEPNPSLRRTGQSAVGTTSLISVPLSVSKSAVLNALNVSKPSGFTSNMPSSTVSIGSSVPSSPSVSSALPGTSGSVSGGGGGGRGGHKSSSTASSAAANSKPVLPTTTHTRTRKIKTPKQYELYSYK